MTIEKAAVIGAGVMGASISAHLANAGVDVHLLDIVPENAKDRSIIAKTAVDKLLKAEPPPLMHKRFARRIHPGNIEDDLNQLSDVDWVIEAVVENIDIKRSIYSRLAEFCNDRCLISSNTSTLPLSLLSEKMPEHIRRRFLITHFFNPPRYMRLLEIVSTPENDTEQLALLRDFADRKLGKSVVFCRDTPGFIGNRIGIYWALCGLHKAIDLGLTVEQADAAISAPFGIPKTGIFGLLDLIGIDLIPHILDAMSKTLPKSDAFHQVSVLPSVVESMIADGYTGRKGKGGFYRLNVTEHGKVKESIDLRTGIYASVVKPDTKSMRNPPESGLQSYLERNDPSASFAWRVMSKTLAYAATLIPEVTDDLTAVDAAMRDGYNWRYGPFELIDQLGISRFIQKLQQDNEAIPPLLDWQKPLYQVSDHTLTFLTITGNHQPVVRPRGMVLLSDFKRLKPAVLHNDSASLWDIGDGVACLEFHSKMNTLDMDSMLLIQQSIEKVGQEFQALVIHNEAEHFSAGANLSLLVNAIHAQQWHTVENLIKTGQRTYQALKYAPYPVVAAPAGLALGGGCEILLHCDAVQAHAELYTGLVEVGVGVIPGWGGCKEYLRRCLPADHGPGGPIPPVVKAFQTISMAKVSKSAIDAQELMFLSKNDGITMNKYRLLADAKNKALSLTKNYVPPQAQEYKLPGFTGKILLEMGIKAFRLLGKATHYDTVIGAHLATVLSGGSTDLTLTLSENDLLNLECNAFVDLAKQPGTLARLEHMLKTGKPLRN